MNNLDISLYGIDYVEPDKFITSDEIEETLRPVYEKLKLPFGRIEMQTGIQSRGIYENKMPSTISTLAAKNLFKESSIKADEIDLLIHGSVCRDFLEPSTASVIHDSLGLRPDCMSFDLSNACLGVVSSIQTAAHMIKTGAIKYALIVTGENSKPLIDQTLKTILESDDINRKSIKKFFANFTIGSAGVALIIGPRNEELPLIHTGVSLTDSSAHKLCQGDGSQSGLVMETDSEALKIAGVNLAKKCFDEFRKMNECEIDHYICHQVGIHHRNFLYEMLKLDLTKDHTSFDKYGNTGSAALPLTLALAVKNKRFKRGAEIALLGIGSGLHTQMLGVTWN